MTRSLTVLAGAAALAVLATPGIAHFVLLEPASWIQEAPNGDPQKMGPCGGTLTDPGKPSGMVTNVTGGEKLHIKVKETVFHPGFYRVALAVNSTDELPKDPEAKTESTANGPRSVSAAIQYPVIPPVLADGLFQHISPFDKEQEADVEIPNIGAAPNARCRLWSSWRPMVSTSPVTSRITIAPYCASALTHTSPSIRAFSPRRSSCSTIVLNNDSFNVAQQEQIGGCADQCNCSRVGKRIVERPGAPARQ